MEKELISVIIPVYNVEKYLEACLESVTNQTYRNIEIILVNDGSTDSSSSICKNYLEKDARIKLVEKTNGGLSDARNAGMEIATGSYFTFIDSDDIVHTDLIMHLWQILADGDNDISICDPFHCFPDKPVEFKASSKTATFSSEQAIVEMLYQNSFLVSAWGKLFKKAVFQDIIFPKGRLFEDIAIMYRVFDHARNIVYSDAKLYGYMHRENSITTRKFDRRDCDILDISQDIVDYFKGRNGSLQQAATVYQTNSALRVLLNAPKDDGYKDVVEECRKIIKSNYKEVKSDKNIRSKLRVGLFLTMHFESVVPFIYKRVDRWK